jgi:hypothetical protein
MPRQIQQEKGAADGAKEMQQNSKEQARFLLVLRAAVALGQKSVAALFGMGEQGRILG